MTKAYTEVAVIRSQNLPLQVLTVAPPKLSFRRSHRAGAPEWIVDFVIDNLYRIEVLHIKPSTDGLRLLMVAAPVLEDFWLQPQLETHSFSLVWESELFKGQAPVLRTLGLVSLRPPLEAGVYKNLTKLDVVAIGAHPLATESIQLVCRESPDLEFLRLRLGIAGEEFLMPTLPPEDRHTRVTMPNLRYLNLYMQVELVAQLLSVICLTQQPEEVKITACSDRGDRIESTLR